MYNKALLVTDLGDSADVFLKCQAGLHCLGVHEIMLVCCVRLHDLPGLRPNVEDILRPDIERRRQTLERQDYSVTAELLLGDPAVEVNQLAEAQNCDLVVVGSRVQGLVGEVFMGGVTGEIMHHCRRPLLVSRCRTDQEICDCRLVGLERALLATDFSNNAERAFAAVVGLVEEGLKSVVLLHVQDRNKLESHLKDRLAEFNAIDQGRLERMKEQLLGKGAQEVSIELPYGLPTEEILQRTRQGDISLTVLGSQGRGFVSEIFMGSVSHNIARRSPAPVLLIPALETR